MIEKELSFGYWNINGKNKLVGDHKMYGILDDTWNGLNGGSWKLNGLKPMMKGNSLGYTHVDE